MNKTIDAEVVDAIAVRESSRALAEQITVARPPEVVLEEARRAAVALQGVISAKPKKIIMNDEQYLEFEDWQTVGRFYGITAKEDGDAEYIQLGPVVGFKASAIAVNADGLELSRATAYCLNDEEKWHARPKYEWHMVLQDGTTAPEESSDKSDWVWEDNPKKPGGKRPKRQRVLVGEESVPLFQLASMSQTRANAKVLRNVLAWVVVLAGYRPTPAEELDAEPQANEAVAPASKPKAAAPTAEPKKNGGKDDLTGAQFSQLWSNAVAQAHKTGATKQLVVGDVLKYLHIDKPEDINPEQFARVLRLIGEWEPGVDFAAAEAG